MGKAMVITVGTGPGVEHGICYAIRSAHPDHVVFLVTERSRGKTLTRVLEDPAMSGRSHAEAPISDPNDVEKVFNIGVAVLDGLEAQGFPVQDVVAEFTSGTKAMSAGLALAAVARQVPTLSYVYGERGREGRVISGTERCLTLSPLRIMVDREFTAYRQLFNMGYYDSCLELLRPLIEMGGPPDIEREWAWCDSLAATYAAWDRFELKRAARTFGQLGKQMPWEWPAVAEQIKKNGQIVKREKEARYCPERAADLLENAIRRAAQGKYEDAVARLYRLLEYLAQCRLFLREEKIETSSVKLNRLPEPLRDKYAAKRSPDGRTRLGLHDSYRLLADLEDPLGKQFADEFDSKGEIREALSKRNAGIGAHGFSPVGKDGYESCLSVAIRYAEAAWPKIDKLRAAARHPQLPTP